MTHMNKQHEMLVITMEECGELVQACSKVIRSNGKEKYMQNLKDEVGDVMTMIEILKSAGVVTQADIEHRMDIKRKKLTKWSNLFQNET